MALALADHRRRLRRRQDCHGAVLAFQVTSVKSVSASGDNGADPNEIVTITDSLAATSLPGTEQFSIFDHPKAGLRYGGVAYASAASSGVPEPSTWAMMAIGLGALRFAGYGRGRKGTGLRSGLAAALGRCTRRQCR